MEPMDTETLSMAILPTEILYHVFLYLPMLELMRCRSVCSVWRSVVDAITRCDEFWQRRCVSDHPTVYEQAHSKCSPDLSWRHLYRSLQLWTKFNDSEETWTELFASDQRRIATTYLYNDSLVIHSGHKIIYCSKDVSTLKKRIQIGQHELFSENDHVACYLSSDLDGWSPMTDLNIVPKSKGELLLDLTVTIYEVYHYVIIEKDVYYGKYYRRGIYRIFVAKWSDNYSSSKVINSRCPILGLSYNEGCLHIMLQGYNVYKKVNDVFEHVNEEDNVFGTLKYGFRYRPIEFEERYELADLMGAKFTISRMLFYNKFIFTGTDHGLLHVYDADEIAQEVKSKPLVEYNIADIFDLEDDVSIRGIDVMERENGHTVFVSTVKKIVKLDLTHCEKLS